MDRDLPSRSCAAVARRMRMQRCECTGVSFDEIARRVADGCSLDEVQVATGAGLLCTACVPDMRLAVAEAAACERKAQAHDKADPAQVEPAA